MSERRPRYGIEALNEADLQRTIEEMLDLRHLLHFHDVDARRNDAGLPDLIWPDPSTRVLHLWELKTEAGKLGPSQIEWGGALAACRVVDYRLIRSSDLEWVREYLGLKLGA